MGEQGLLTGTESLPVPGSVKLLPDPATRISFRPVDDLAPRRDYETRPDPFDGCALADLV